MALGQIFESPLTLYSGSIISNTVPAGSTQGNILFLPTASLPPFQTSPWQFRIKTDPFSTTSSTQQTVNDLTITLANSAKYLVIAYLGVSNTSSTSASRIGVTATNIIDNLYSVEVPSSATAVVIGNLQTSSPTTFPANSSATNYYFAKITALVITAGTGTPTWAPTISTLTATTTTAAIGPSVVYYRLY
jgi:hypothetical protein